MEILLSLLSGLIGSIVGAILGGVLSYKGAINATKKQVDSLYAQEKESRAYAEKQQIQAMTHALAMEIEENIYLATNLWAGFGSSQSIMINTTSLLSTEAWTTYRGNISSLPSSLQIKLLNAYAEIRQFNTLVEDNRRHYISGNITVGEAIEAYAKRVLETCKAVKEEITKV